MEDFASEGDSQTFKYFDVARVLEKEPFGLPRSIDSIRKQAGLSHSTVKHCAKQVLLLRHFFSLAIPHFRGKRGWIARFGLASFAEYFFEPEDRVLLKLYDQRAYERPVAVREIFPTEVEAQIFCKLFTGKLVESTESKIRLTAKGISRAFKLKKKYEEYTIQAVSDPANCAKDLASRVRKIHEINSKLIEQECFGLTEETHRFGEFLEKAKLGQFDERFDVLEREVMLGSQQKW